MLKPGETLIDHYVVEQHLGRGGFSQTYLVRDRNLPNYPLCVAKCFSPNSTAIHGDEIRRLFKREAQVLQKLGHHESIPRLLAWNSKPNLPCLIQEYMYGTTLLNDIQHQRYWCADEIVRLLQDVLTVLAFIHAHHIIHGDIKPSNLIQQANCKIAIVDFGAATCPDEPTLESISFGTPGYIAPEQAAGRPTFSSDLYALGMTAIYLMSGKAPTQLERNSTSKSLIWEPVRSHTLNSKLISILNRLTHPGRQRYQQTGKVIDDLKRIQPDSARFVDRRLIALPAIAQGFKSAKKQVKQWGQTVQFKHQFKRKITIIAAIIAVIWFIQDIKSFASPIVASITQHLDIETADWNQKPLSLQHLHTIAIPTNLSIEQLILTPDYLVARTHHRIIVWNTQTAAIVNAFDLRSSNWIHMTTSRDGVWLAAVDRDRRVTVWDLASKQIIQSFVEPRTIVSLAISPDRKMIATSDDAGIHRIRQIHTGNVVQLPSSNQPDATMLFTDSGQFVYTTSDHQIKVWNFESSQLKQVFAGHTDSILLLQASDNKLYSFGKDAASVWNVDRAELTTVFPTASAGIVAAQIIESDPQRLLTVNQAGKLQLWNPASGKLLQTIAHLGGTATISADGLLANHEHNQLQIWRIN